MRSFDFEKEYSKLLTPDIVSYIAQIHEYRGRYSADNVQKELLSELLEIARIQSTEASNRIEGIITTDDRLKKIVREKHCQRQGVKKKSPDTGMFWQRFMKTMNIFLSVQI